MALANSNRDSNLLIYELDPEQKLLSHHQSISLPNIAALKWLDSVSEVDRNDREDINFLLSGHTDGIVHLNIIPEPENDVFQNAEIIKRFNHNKHTDVDNNFVSGTINKLETSPRRWRSCNMNSLLTIYKSNVFMWDTSRSRAPILKYKSVGIKNLNASPCNDGLLGVCGAFGIALLDLRAPEGTPNYYVPHLKNNGVANNIKWSPFDANVLASSYEDGIVKLWDVRMTRNSFARLEGHKDIVTSIEWSESAANDLFTSSKDGKIIHWDLSDIKDYTTIDDELKCGPRVGLASSNNSGEDQLLNNLIQTRQCGTVIPASTNSILDLANIGDGKILSIDGGSFLGLHDKTVKKSNKSEEIMNELLTSMSLDTQEKPSMTDDTSSLESLSMPKTPKSQTTSFFQKGDKSLSASLNSQHRVASDSTLVDGVTTPPGNLKRMSYFQTQPLPYSFEPEMKSPSKESKMSLNKKSHKRSLSLISKMRDFSGSTLTSKKTNEEDLLTDLSIEDDFTFKPVFPLTVNKIRPTYQ